MPTGPRRHDAPGPDEVQHHLPARGPICLFRIGRPMGAGMRGSRMRDRRPPSNPWDCGTRAANISRQRAILMAFNTPFALCWRYFLDFMHHCLPQLRRPRPEPFTCCWSWHVRRWYSLLVHADCCGSASTAGTLQPLGPGTSDLLPVHFLPQLLCPRPGPFGNCWPWHVRRCLLFILLWQRVHGRDPSTARSWHVRPSAPLFTASSLSSSYPRSSGQFVVMPTSCSALVDPFLAMSETLPPPATDVYFSHYRFSVPGT